MDEEKYTDVEITEETEVSEVSENDVENELNEKNDEIEEVEETIETPEIPEKNSIEKSPVNLKARLVLITLVICILGFWLFNSQFTKGIIYNIKNQDENTSVIKLENGFGLNTGVFGDVIVTSSRNSVKLYNKKGKLIQTDFTEEIYGSIPEVANLVIKTSDDYMLAYDEGGKMFYKINEKGVEFSTKLDYNIILAKPFDNNMFAVVTEDSGSNHQVRIYNSDCKEVYIWHSGGSSVLDASVNKKGNKMVIASIETIDGKINTKVSLFNLNETLPYVENVFSDNMVTSVNYASENDVVALGDKYLSHISSNGKITSNYSYNNRRLHTYKHLDNGSVVLAYQRNNDNDTLIEIVSKKGSLKGFHKIDLEVISLDSSDDNILVGTKNDFILLGSKGMQLRKSKTTREIRKALFMDENEFLLIGNSEIKISK